MVLGSGGGARLLDLGLKVTHIKMAEEAKQVSHVDYFDHLHLVGKITALVGATDAGLLPILL